MIARQNDIAGGVPSPDGSAAFARAVLAAAADVEAEELRIKHAVLGAARAKLHNSEKSQ